MGFSFNVGLPPLSMRNVKRHKVTKSSGHDVQQSPEPQPEVYIQNTPISSTKNLSLAGMSVMVNPGHGVIRDNGVKDAGATTIIRDNGKKKRITEADLNKDVAQRVRVDLEKRGAKVIYVENMEIHQIQNLENKLHPDLFIAIHHDAGKGKGKTVYGWGNSLSAAEDITNALNMDKTIPINKMKPSWAKDLCVLKADQSIPAVLIEMGYVTKKNELNKLMDPNYQNVEAQLVSDGIEDFLTKQKNLSNRQVKRPNIFNLPSLLDLIAPNK